MSPLRTSLGVLLLTLGLVPALAAQARPHRTGFFMEIGAGPASARVGCSGCEEVTRNSGTSSTIRVGFPLSDHVLISLEAYSFSDEGFAFANANDKAKTESGTTSIALLWYPGKSGFFLTGGTGIASSDFTVQREGQSDLTVQGSGVALTVGVGYDLTLSRRFAFTTNAGIHVGAIGDVALPASNVDDVIATIYSVNIGFTLR